ncbi:hypothetical protein ACJMK2_041628 [Sinanodonta woodiana]|uniref:Thioredoxin n=1 Tax=Sinanodonta woodiana TaxID=1069815 RepID=A0ABD3W4S2_SINWO
MRAGTLKKVLHNKDLQETLKKAGNKLVVVDFWAGWCGPCKVIDPVVQALAVDPGLQDKVVFVKVDVDEASEVAEAVGIECMPTFVFFKNGHKVDDMSGANGEKLKELIQKHI